jgi:hypothetical protein
VLGQLSAAIDPSTLSVGAEMRLVVETLSSDDEHEYLIWRWKPAA